MESEFEFSTIFENKIKSVGEEEKSDLSFSMIVDNGIQTHKKSSPFQTVQPRTRTRWVEDNSVSRCSCGETFGMFFRKGHCILSGTPVTLSNGLSIPIENVLPNSNVQSYDIDKCKVNINDGVVNANFDQGLNPCMKLTLEDGRELISTADHRILTMYKDTNIYTQMKDITKDHKIICSTVGGVVDKVSEDLNCTYHIKGTTLYMNTHRNHCLIFARLCGYNMTDGTLNEKGNGITFYVGDKDDMETLCTDIEYLLGMDKLTIKRVPLINNGRSNLYNIKIFNKLLSSWMKNAGVTTGNKVNKGMRLPHFMWDDKCPKSIQREFIAGWFGGDGSRFGKNGKGLKIDLHLISVNILDQKDKNPLEHAENSVDRMCEILKNCFGLTSIKKRIKQPIAIIKNLHTIANHTSPQQLNVIISNENKYTILFDTNTHVLKSILLGPKSKINIIQTIMENMTLCGQQNKALNMTVSKSLEYLEKHQLIVQNRNNIETVYEICRKGTQRYFHVNSIVLKMNNFLKDDKIEDLRITKRIGMQFNVNDANIFTQNIGYRYCVQKQAKMTIGCAFLNIRKLLANQRLKLIHYALDTYLHLDSTFKDPRIHKIIYKSVKYPNINSLRESMKKCCDFIVNENIESNIADSVTIKCITDILIGRSRIFEKSSGKILTHVQTETFDQFLKRIHFDWNLESRKSDRYFALNVKRIPESYQHNENQQVYDISVPGYTSFVANGIVVHNCRFCGGVFCYNCTSKKIMIPEYLNIPTPAHGKEFNHTDNVKVCSECYIKIYQVKQIQVLIEVFNLVELDIFDFKNIARVCTTWNQLANFYLSKIREIQYTLPTHTYDEYEQNALWINRNYFVGHNIWMTHLFRSINYQQQPYKKKEILTLLDDHIELSDSNKDSHECWELMCTRRCQRHLSSECALMLLDTSQERNKLPEIRKFAINYLFSDNVETEELCCYINYLVQCASTSRHSIIIDSLIEESCKFEVGKGMECELNKRCIRIASELYWELQIGIQNDSVFLVQKYQEMIEQFDENINQPFKQILYKTLQLVDTIQHNYDADNPIDIVKALGEIDTTVSPLHPERGELHINASHVEIKQSMTKPLIIPMNRENHTNVIMYKKEDVRKDQIIMSIIKLMDLVLKKEMGIDMGIITYRVRPTTPNEGFIDIVGKCCTLYQIQKKQMTLLNYILDQNPDSTLSEIRNRFVKSCAGYCIITYLLGIGDRHLDNIMVMNDGRLFHIDYGFILGQDPKPLNVSHIRISADMMDALGGDNSPSYEYFKKLCDTSYNVLRRHLNLFACLLGLFVTSQPRIDGSKHFTSHKVLKEIAKRFAPGENYKEAEIHIHNRINNSTTTASTFRYGVIDFFHRHNKEKTVKNVISSTATTTYSATKGIVEKIWNIIMSTNNVNIE